MNLIERNELICILLEENKTNSLEDRAFNENWIRLLLEAPNKSVGKKKISKMNTIKVTLEPSESYKTITITPEDLGFSEQEWLEMSEEAKQEAIQNYAEELPEQPYWFVKKIDNL